MSKPYNGNPFFDTFDKPGVITGTDARLLAIIVERAKVYELQTTNRLLYSLVHVVCESSDGRFIPDEDLLARLGLLVDDEDGTSDDNTDTEDSDDDHLP